MIKFLWHYAHAIEFRFNMLRELAVIKKQNKHFTTSLWWHTLRRPTTTEDWINFLRFINPSSAIHLIDVGANNGSWAAGFLQIFPNTQLTCFEPVTTTFQELTARFGERNRTTLHNCALSDSPGSALINLTDESTFASFEEFDDRIVEARDKKVTGTIEVDVQRLDDINPSSNDDRVQMLKIDVQGHEVEMLKGASNVLKNTDVVLCEVTFASEYKNRPPSFSHVCELLRVADLYPIIFQEYGRQASSFAVERDVLFVKQELLEQVFDTP